MTQMTVQQHTKPAVNGVSAKRAHVNAGRDTKVSKPVEIEIKKENVAPLFTPFKVGKYELTNRLVYPPLTRMRATPEGVPQPHMVEYYSQRANPGSLFIAEGTYVNPASNGYPCAPGIYTSEQVAAWKPVVAAVKDRGAVFFNQLWHCGRASHPALQPGNQLPVAPSELAISNPAYKVYLPDFTAADYPVPQALTKEGIKATIEDYRKAARNAIDAGFDGVEIHGANGYLIHQFIADGTNKRTDEYGGSIENRCRFALEVVAAVVDEVGADRVGIRLSPFTDFLDAIDSTPYATWIYLVEQLNKFNLAYLHMVEARMQGNDINEHAPGDLTPFRKVFQGPFIAAGGYKPDNAAEAVASGHTDLVAFGRLWLATPDLPKRVALGAPLNRYDRNTFYGGNTKGYTDYPFLEEVDINNHN